jgi:hypothetical protein
MSCHIVCIRSYITDKIKMIEWLDQNVGRNRYVYMYPDVTFCDEEDATFFTLKFGIGPKKSSRDILG